MNNLNVREHLDNHERFVAGLLSSPAKQTRDVATIAFACDTKPIAVGKHRFISPETDIDAVYSLIDVPAARWRGRSGWWFAGYRLGQRFGLPGVWPAPWATRRALEAGIGPTLREKLEQYDRQLKAWLKTMIDQVTHAYDAQAEVFRQQLRRLATNAAATSDTADRDRLAADIQALRQVEGATPRTADPRVDVGADCS